MRVTPPNAEAAPMTAYTLGLMQPPSAGQSENTQLSGLARWIWSITRPTARPTQAPTVRDGRKMPAGMEEPNVTAVRRVLAKAAMKSRRTTAVAFEVLCKRIQYKRGHTYDSAREVGTYSHRPYGSGSLQSRNRFTTSSADGIRMKTMR